MALFTSFCNKQGHSSEISFGVGSCLHDLKCQVPGCEGLSLWDGRTEGLKDRSSGYAEEEDRHPNMAVTLRVCHLGLQVALCSHAPAPERWTSMSQKSIPCSSNCETPQGLPEKSRGQGRMQSRVSWRQPNWGFSVLQKII